MVLEQEDIRNIHSLVEALRFPNTAISGMNCFSLSGGTVWLDSSKYHPTDPEFRRHQQLLDYMRREELLELESTTKGQGRMYKLAPKGEDVQDSGGFVSYFERKENQKRQDAEDREVTRRKEKHEAKLAEWQVKAFWPLFFFGTIGGVYAIIQIIQSFI